MEELEVVDEVGDGGGEIVEAPEVIDIDGNGIQDWVEDLMSKGWSMELGPEKMSKTKHSKKLMGKNRQSISVHEDAHSMS